MRPVRTELAVHLTEQEIAAESAESSLEGWFEEGCPQQQRPSIEQQVVVARSSFEMAREESNLLMD